MARLQFLHDFLAQRQLRRERVFRDRSNPLDSMNDNQLRERFRFDRQTIMFITDLIQDNLNNTRRNFALLPAQQVMIALRYYATGTFQLVCGDDIGVQKYTSHNAIWKVTNALISKKDEYIKFPTGNTADKVKSGFFKVANFPGILGCIDGSHIRIQRPKMNEFQFVNRKFYHSVNIQAACNDLGMFINIAARWPGSTHDSRILKTSALFEEFEANVHDGILLGDSGYPLKPWLLTPLNNPETEAEKKYNISHKKTRVLIEQTFGRWKRRFHLMHSELRVEPPKACKLIVATAILHNIAIIKKQGDFNDLVFDDGEGMEIADYEGPENGRGFRQHVINMYFS